MATTVQLPDGRTAEFPDGMSRAEIEEVLKRQFQPPEEQPSALARGVGLTTRAAAPTLVGAQLGAAGGPMGAVLGSVAVPAADALNQLLNAIASPFTDRRLMPASQAIQNLMTRAGVPAAPETQTPTERVASAGLETMTSLGRTLPEFIRRGVRLPLLLLRASLVRWRLLPALRRQSRLLL